MHFYHQLRDKLKTLSIDLERIFVFLCSLISLRMNEEENDERSIDFSLTHHEKNE